MQETLDRLQVGYSINTNPGLAIGQANTTGNDCATPLATTVEAQVYVSRLSGINQKAGSFDIEGYFRLWWTDARLKYNGTADGGCLERLTVRVDETEKAPFWTPDIYFDINKKNEIGKRSDGAAMYVYPDGVVLWTQRIRSTVNCAMNFGG